MNSTIVKPTLNFLKLVEVDFYNKDVLFVNIMGVGKNGTTLLGSLLDNHHELSSFPMEMKFVEHFLHNVKSKNFSS